MCLCCQHPPDHHTPSQGPPHRLGQGPMDTPASGSSQGWRRQLGGPPALYHACKPLPKGTPIQTASGIWGSPEQEF